MNSEKTHRRTLEILAAAQKVFAAKGFHDATVAEVAREAGVSEKTVYEYFPSKEALLFEIPVRPTAEAVADLQRHLPYLRGAANKIRAIMYHFVSYYVAHPEYARVILLFLRTNSSFLKTRTFEELRLAYRVIDAAVEEGIAAGELPASTSPELVRWLVVGAVDYLVLRWLQQGAPEDPLATVDPLADLLLGGITGGAAAGSWTLRIAVEPAGAAGDRIVATPADAVEPRPAGSAGVPPGASAPPPVQPSRAAALRTGPRAVGRQG